MTFDVNPADYRPRQLQGKRVASPEYRSWQMMKNRCTNPKYACYEHYGARGIKFDPRWAEFDNFIRDMGPIPVPTYSLDREDADKDYDADNCKWASKAEQSRNRRCCVLTLERAQALRAAWVERLEATQAALARKFGISRQLCAAVIEGKIWCE